MRRFLVLLLLAAALVLVGCAGVYENDNGPRGPERFTWGFPSFCAPKGAQPMTGSCSAP